MIKKILSFLLTLSLSIQIQLKADEGMWIPMLIGKNFEQMQKLGIKLTPDDIYNINKSSLKDAIVNFGGFCTGEVISKEGLVLTNHHCGFDAIQAQSSVQNDLLSNGFWAKSRDQELPSPGLTVTFLVRIEDVTNQVLSEISSIKDWNAKEEKIEEVGEAIGKKATEGTHYTAEVKSFFENNVFYMFIYEVYTDVRMVAAPPSSIGKFGGDTDNWMWPRHTGDFSVFRIYSGTDGKPAEYSKDNIPLKPKYFLPVSLKGINPGDFAMVMGYPGGTERYMSSEGVRMTYDQSNPMRVKIRGERLALMKQDMDKNEEVKIKYAAKYAHISNYYKYWIGQNQGIKRLNVIEDKKQQEQDIQIWIRADAGRQKKYGDVTLKFNDIYKDYRKYNPSYVYLEEVGFGIEIVELAYHSMELYGALASNASKDELNKVIAEFKKQADEHFKNYNAPTDKKIMAALLKMYYNEVDKEFHPGIFATIEKKYRGDFNKYAEYVFKTSILASKEKLYAFLANPTFKVMRKDPGFQTMSSLIGNYHKKIKVGLQKANNQLQENNNLFVKAIMEKKGNDALYPDANFTMRLTYGTVQDYYPRDAVHYLYRTTLAGVMEKEDPSNEEFIVSKKLKELFEKKDFGHYAQNGEMFVCFITNNDITGGNSGSPVIDAEGNLIGTAFDGNWEAMSGDIIFEPELQRCIITDIRYVLFILDKFGGLGYLVDEMTLVEKKEVPENTSSKEIKDNSNGTTTTKKEKVKDPKAKEKKLQKVY
ncbi:MAG: S46 family peptidase [Cytophagaceae bacterium]|nr:S46 family peptidase [Cytophagaceae bacterium]